MRTKYKYGKSNLPPFRDGDGKKKQVVCYFSDICDLWKGALHVCVPGRGSKEPKLLLVGEAPGPVEDQKNKPFVGPAGGVLKESLQDAEIPGTEIRITNAARCFPQDERGGIRSPTDEEFEACSHYLIHEIQKYKPEIIVPMGKSATDWFLGEGDPIGRRRGRFHEMKIEGKPYRIFPTWHPAFILRKRDAQEQLTSDLRRAYRYAMGASDPEQLLDLQHFTDLGKFADWVEETVQLFHEEKIDRLGYDLETSGPTREIALDAYHPDSYIIGISLSRDEGSGTFLTLQHPEFKDSHDPLALRGLLRKIFDLPVCVHSGKFDLRFATAKLGVCPRNLVFDSKLACYLIDGKDGSHSLKYLGGKYLDYGQWDAEINQYLMDNVPISKERTFDKVPLDLIWRYGAIDANATHRLVPFIKKEKLHGKPKTRALLEKLLRATVYFNDLELHGNRIDYDEWKRLLDVYEQRTRSHLDVVRASKAGRKAEKILECELNLNSPDHKRLLIHECLGVPTNPDFVTPKKKDPSTSDDALLWMLDWSRDQQEKETERVLKELRASLKVGSIRSKYLVSLEKYIQDGVLHPNYKFHVQYTGRGSTSKPTIHTLPKGSDIRRMFVSKWYGEGGLILDCDYSQLEVRVLAALCQDPRLRQAYARGEDVHSAVAAQIWKGHPLDYFKNTDKGKRQRHFAKTVVFGIIYGRGAEAIAKATGLTKQAAKEIIDRLFAQFPAVKEYIKKQHRLVKKKGRVFSPTGREYPLPHVHGDDEFLRAKAQRQAQNYPIQGGASDITLFSVLETHEAIQENGYSSHIWNWVHDAQYVDVYPGELLDIWDIVMEKMEKSVPSKLDWCDIPIVADPVIGVRWDGSMEAKRVDDKVFILKGPVPFYKELHVHMRDAYHPKFRVIRQWSDPFDPFDVGARQAYAGEAAGDMRVEVEMTLP